MLGWFGQAALFLISIAFLLFLVLVIMVLLYKIVEFARRLMPQRHDYFQEYEELEDSNRTQVTRRR